MDSWTYYADFSPQGWFQVRLARAGKDSCEIDFIPDYYAAVKISVALNARPN